MSGPDERLHRMIDAPDAETWEALVLLSECEERELRDLTGHDAWRSREDEA